jgi:ferredoxin
MVKQRVVLTFPKETIEQPITYHLIKDYNLIINILSAKIKPNEEGRLIIEIKGEDEDFERAMKHLEELNVSVQSLTHDVYWDRDRCVDCTVCVPLCPSNAFDVDRDKMEVSFDSEKCMACGLCVKACPYQAMKIAF